jgi:hypothetical protein
MIAGIAMCALAAQASPPVKLISPLPTALVQHRVVPTKEPIYGRAPRYGLISVDGGKSMVWFVIDGTKLYLDRNGNGDLTDDGPPIESKKLDYLKKPHVYFEWPSLSPKGTSANLTEGSLLAYVNGDEYRIGDFRHKIDGMFWFYRNRGVTLAAKASEAPILNLGAPLGLLFDFINGTDGTLSKNKANEFFVQIGSQGSEAGSFLCRSYEDMPKDAYIEADFQLVDQRNESTTLHQIVQLRTRC